MSSRGSPGIVVWLYIGARDLLALTDLCFGEDGCDSLGFLVVQEIVQHGDHVQLAEPKALDFSLLVPISPIFDKIR